MTDAPAPVVMVHGAFCGGWTFEAFRKPFEAAGFRPQVPDLRGHGTGDPPDAVRNLSMLDYAADIAARMGRRIGQSLFRPRPAARGG